ncbi:hypothetical protein FRB90_010351 [Tulasnella sp. 427]|nr:hypothetical protein FRB90_010351 [Tulasnella sp. 427]
MRNASLFLCIDCGGTKTAAAIVDANCRVLSRGSGGPSNYNDVGQAKFIQAISEATRQALSAIPGCERFNIPLSEPVFTAVWIGASGIDRKQDVLDITPVIADLLHHPTQKPTPRLRSLEVQAPTCPPSDERSTVSS